LRLLNAPAHTQNRRKLGLFCMSISIYIVAFYFCRVSQHVRLDAWHHTWMQTQCTGWPRLIGSLIFIAHFPQKRPIFSGSFVENDPSSLSLVFHERDLYLVALLWKMICNLGVPMSLRHPVITFIHTSHPVITFIHTSQLLSAPAHENRRKWGLFWKSLF